jgi:hypothetical protein
MEGAERAPPPQGILRTSGQEAPERKCIVAAFSAIWVVASVAKSANWNSSIGRCPFIARPIAYPVQVLSASGRFMTLERPNSP